jgi:hypothetical protein
VVVVVDVVVVVVVEVDDDVDFYRPIESFTVDSIAYALANPGALRDAVVHDQSFG